MIPTPHRTPASCPPWLGPPCTAFASAGTSPRTSPVAWETSRSDLEHDEEGETVATLRGVLADQAALAGLLSTLYTYHLPILSIECLGATEPPAPDSVHDEE